MDVNCSIAGMFHVLQFIALGTHWGHIHILDYQGNSIRGKEYEIVSSM